MKHAFYMQRCIDLASNGAGNVAPNPMVGAVLVLHDKIIGEGYHQKIGGAHAEVNAVASVSNKKMLAHCTLYVSLEPCNHFGKTPPCTDLILKYKIPKVVIGSLDPNPLVAGAGIKRLKAAGVEVLSGILREECEELNKRFFYYHEHKLPYVILKWAQSGDGFIGDAKQGNIAISNAFSQQLVHKWRSEESAILVGTTTARLDNPSLTVRNFAGKNPLRLVIDWENKLPDNLKLFDQSNPTLVFTRKHKPSKTNMEYVVLKKSKSDLRNLLEHLAKKSINSVFVEGGAKLLQSFIDEGLWNEARVFTSSNNLQKGVKAPIIRGKKVKEVMIKNDTLVFLKNQ